MLVKHMRLTKDVIVKEDNGRKYALGTGVYDLYRGKDKQGQPQYQSVFVNLAANSDREVNFLENFGKKGSVLKVSGEVTPGKPYQKDGEWISTINVNIDSVKFSDVRMGQSTQGATDAKASGTGTKAPAKTETKASTQQEELQEVEDIFEFWGNEEEETA